MSNLAYQRILLKLSGEVLKNPDSGDPIDPEILLRVCKQLKENHEDDPDCYPLDDDAAIIDDFYQFLIEG